jgi:hypothetical protein
MASFEQYFKNIRGHSMQFTRMETPSTRAEFEERMNYAHEALKNGKMHFAKGMRGPESLLRVRLLPNGRVDLLSIDESARLMANNTYQMRNLDLDEMFPDNAGAG